MPIACDYFPAFRLVHTLGYETVRFEDLCRHFAELASDPRYQRPMKKIVRYVDHLVVQQETAEARRLPEIKKRYHHTFVGEQCAIVAPTDFEYGMARLHQNSVDEAGVENVVVRTAAEALAWLEIDLNAPDFQPWWNLIEAKFQELTQQTQAARDSRSP